MKHILQAFKLYIKRKSKKETESPTQIEQPSKIDTLASIILSFPKEERTTRHMLLPEELERAQQLQNIKQYKVNTCDLDAHYWIYQGEADIPGLNKLDKQKKYLDVRHYRAAEFRCQHCGQLKLEY